MKTLQLTGAQSHLCAKVDAHRYEELSKYSWSGGRSSSGRIYPKTSVKGETWSLSHAVLGIPPGAKVVVDHFPDKDTLNNQEGNLRVVSEGLSRHNRDAWSISGYKGVYPSKSKKNPWQVNVCWTDKNGEKHFRYGGVFACKHEAALAANQILIEIWGKDAVLNNVPIPFPQETPESAESAAAA
jgi:hypothetical protein